MTTIVVSALETRSLPARIRVLAPGVALTAMIAAGAFALRRIPGAAVLSPLILAILIGMTLLFNQEDG